jgi:hypothetical protein
VWPPGEVPGAPGEGIAGSVQRPPRHRRRPARGLSSLLPALLLLALWGTGSAAGSADGRAPVVDITVTSGSR